MTARLRSEFMLDADIRSGGNYTIETENGSVYLIGSARSQAELDRATRIARYIRVSSGSSLMLSCALAPRLPNNRCSRSLPPARRFDCFYSVRDPSRMGGWLIMVYFGRV